jgi:hypothetical protein
MSCLYLVSSLQTCPCEKTKSQLKYKEKGLIISTAQAAVVKNAPVRYRRDINGISMYLVLIEREREREREEFIISSNRMIHSIYNIRGDGRPNITQHDHVNYTP